MVLAGSAFFPDPAHALGETCSVSSTGVAFGTVDVLPGSAINTTGTITVTCEALLAVTLPYSVTLSTGGSGSYTTRKMTNPNSSTFNYNIFRDSGPTNILGDGVAPNVKISDQFILTLLNLNQTRNHTVYAQIYPNQQGTAPGVYSDNITVTVIY